MKRAGYNGSGSGLAPMVLLPIANRKAAGRPAFIKKTGMSECGIPCPACGCRASAVIDSRAGTDGRCRRRRMCMKCEARFTTYEVIAVATVIDFQI